MLTINITTEHKNKIFQTNEVEVEKDNRGVSLVIFKGENGTTCHRRQTVSSQVYVMSETGDTISKHYLNGGTETELVTKPAKVRLGDSICCCKTCNTILFVANRDIFYDYVWNDDSLISDIPDFECLGYCDCNDNIPPADKLKKYLSRAPLK